MSNEFDVVIVGGGLAGTALAVALQRTGLKLALVHAQTAPPAASAEGWDSRVYAVTPGNADFLRGLGVWDALDGERVAPIHAMHVWGDDVPPEKKPSLDFDAYAAGLPALGYIAEERLLQAGLWNALDDVDVYSLASCQHLEQAADTAVLTLSDGRQLTAKLVVGADGGNSWVRQQAGIAVSNTPYGQQGVVANFAVEKPHHHIARQWFRRDGVLAWLPLPGQRMSMVWSAFDAQAEELMQMPSEALCSTVAEAGQHALGALQLITPAAAFPLVMQRNQAMIAPRLALVGDAAHRVHPLAGQGINLGWRDVQVLAKVLTEHKSDVGAWLCLRRYERARKADVLAMQGVTYGLQKLFNNDDPVLGWLRNTGLNAVNRIGPLKRLLMAQAV